MAFIKKTLNEETIFRDSRVRFRVLKSGMSFQFTLFKDQCGGGEVEEGGEFVVNCPRLWGLARLALCDSPATVFVSRTQWNRCFLHS